MRARLPVQRVFLLERRDAAGGRGHRQSHAAARCDRAFADLRRRQANRVTGVRVVDAHTRKTTEYFARVVFLCASTLNSTGVLLNSRVGAFPERARQ